MDGYKKSQGYFLSALRGGFYGEQVVKTKIIVGEDKKKKMVAL